MKTLEDDYPAEVTIIEVGPRDGLQNERKFVATRDKIRMINELATSGLRHIEVTSFVSPGKIPQLADNEIVFKSINKPHHVHFSALVPNTIGMERALEAEVGEIAIFTAASESFNKRNINCSISESIERFIPVMELARTHNIYVRAYISCVLGCPYEGIITPAQVVAVTDALIDLGVDEISFGDTIGTGTPAQTKQLIKALSGYAANLPMAMHFHDTYGQAIANIYAALEYGITRFDASVAGLGGCPYAVGARGNVATEDVLYLMHGLGVETGVDIYKIVKTGQMICKILDRPNQSRVACALLGSMGAS